MAAHSEITWKYGSPAKEKMIQLTEEYFNVIFPSEYVEIVKQHDGGKPEPNGVRINGKEVGSIGRMLVVCRNDDEGMEESHGRIEPYLPTGVIPFAIEGSGDYFCFDYRNSEGTNPKIVYWQHELSAEAYDVDMSDVDDDDFEEYERMKQERLNELQNESLTDVCNSFAELLTMLEDE